MAGPPPVACLAFSAGRHSNPSRRDIGGLAVSVGAHHDLSLSTLFLRTSFQPVDVSAVEARRNG